MERPLVFFVVIGIALVLAVYYGGPSVFNSGPIATGPGQGIGEPAPGLPEPLSFGGGQTSSQKPKAGISPFQGIVRISTVRYSESDFKKEYLTISSSGFFGFGSNQKNIINLAGWAVENNKGLRFVIPPAISTPFVGLTPEPIQLNPGGEVLIMTGDSPFGTSFQENMCTGYLNESYSLSPTLEESCPDFSKEALLKEKLNSTCVDLIDRATRCRQVRIGFEESAAGNDCIAFAKSHLNYAGCVNDNKGVERFSTGRWRVFLKANQKIWDSLHDRVTLRDKNGLIVDEYVY